MEATAPCGRPIHHPHPSGAAPGEPCFVFSFCRNVAKSPENTSKLAQGGERSQAAALQRNAPGAAWRLRPAVGRPLPWRRAQRPEPAEAPGAAARPRA